MTSHSRAPGRQTRLFPGLLLLLLLFAGAGCTAHRAETGAREETASSFIDAFMRKVIANDHEGAFHDLDMEALVNYGRRIGEVYKTLPPSMKERFRKDFVEGIYARLFRDLPRASVTPRVVTVEGDPFTLEVTGSSKRKNLFFTVNGQKGGMKIVRIEKSLPLFRESLPAETAPTVEGADAFNPDKPR